MKLLLSSKGLINEESRSNFIDFAGTNKKVTLVTTASQAYKEKNRNTIELASTLNKLRYSVAYIDIEFDHPKQLAKSEVIILNGGNPYYLLHHIKMSKSDKVLSRLIHENIPVMGISAGFMILMSDLGIIDLLTPEMNNIGLKDKKAMGIIDEIIIPHYDRFIKEGKINKEDIDKYEAQSTKRVIRLGEYQYITFQNNTLKIEGELTL